MFTKEEEKKIGLIMNMCTDNDTLKKNLEKKYDNNPSTLNIYEIYVLETVFRYGNNGYFEKLLKCGGVSEVIRKYKTFMDNCANIPNFELEKVKEYCNKPSSLTEIEKLGIKLILKNKEKKRILENKMMYTYDDYVDIKLDSDSHIKEAITHIFFIKTLDTLFKERIDKETYYNIISRQIKPGMFSSSDKFYLSELLRDLPDIGYAIINITEKYFDIIKIDVENGNGLSLLINQFGEGIEDVKINISFYDVYGDLVKNNLNDKNKKF